MEYPKYLYLSLDEEGDQIFFTEKPVGPYITFTEIPSDLTAYKYKKSDTHGPLDQLPQVPAEIYVELGWYGYFIL
jgi:hypothetical protein